MLSIQTIQRVVSGGCRTSTEASPIPQHEEKAAPPFLGETQEAVIRALFRHNGVTDSQDAFGCFQSPQFQLALNPELATAPLKRVLEFSVNGCKDQWSVEQILNVYREEYAKRGGTLQSARLLGSSAPALPGTLAIGHKLSEFCKEAAPLLTAEGKSHIDTQFSDIDFQLDLRLPLEEQGTPIEGLLHFFSMRYWWDRAPFRVQFRDNAIRVFNGFKSLLELSDVINISTVKGPDLEEKVIHPKHFRRLPKYSQEDAEKIFKELYNKELIKFIAETAFEEWHFFQNFQLHRMRCRDSSGHFFDFTSLLGSIEYSPRIHSQKLSINYANWLTHKSATLYFEGSLKGLFHKRCKLICWTEEKMRPRDFFYYYWLITLGHLEGDLSTAVGLQNVLKELVGDKVSKIVDFIDSELVARNLAEKKLAAKRSKPKAYGKCLAFLFNICTHLPENCSTTDIYRICSSLSPLVAPEVASSKFYSLLHRFMTGGELEPKLILPALQMISFESLFRSYADRKKEYLQPCLMESCGKYVLHLVVEGQTLLLPFDPVQALETLISNEVAQSVLTSLFDLAIFSDPLHQDPESPLLKEEVAQCLDLKALFEAALKGLFMKIVLSARSRISCSCATLDSCH